MASADSKYDDLSDADIDSLIEKATGWGISVLKGKVANFKFSFKPVEVLLRVVKSVASFVQCIQFE